MKTVLLSALALCLSLASTQAEDSFTDQLRKAAEKLKNEVSKVKDQTEVKGREWYKKAKERLAGVVVWDREFPRTASQKLKREPLARELRSKVDRTAVHGL